MSSTKPLIESLQALTAKVFTPHPAVIGSDMQTILGLALPYFKDSRLKWQRQIIKISSDTSIAADLALQANAADHPTVLIVPGINGVSDSPVMRALGHKAYHAGYNVVCLNLPNQGGTAHLNKRYYYIGQSEVVTGTIQALAKKQLKDIYLIGVSYSGNICAKAVGELGEKASRTIKGLVLMSPAIDPVLSMVHTERRRNAFYEFMMVSSLNKLNKERFQVDPENFSRKPQKTLRAWIDTHMTDDAPIGWGFKDTDDYFARNSAMQWMDSIRIPTLIIHSKDDQLVPPSPELRALAATNPHLRLLLTEHGGHCGFIAKKKLPGDLDRHWDQNRALEFFDILKRAVQPTIVNP